ncbi:MAG: 2-succinyl-5-enolpyruvyl-6-hydroxy-3-cyclohexene-1-carboxylic-acid synthase [Bdellovibrio sp.]
MKNIFKTNLNRLWCAQIIDELKKNGINDYFIAPGMRNAPIISAVLETEDLNVFEGMDERALAYRALGHSKITQKSSVLICTSGTAVANFFPAVIEASLTSTPLFVISADRPVELVKSGANQAIEQRGILSPYVANELHLPPPEEGLAPLALRKMIAHLITESHIQKRPVHLNVPLKEPLDLTPGEISSNYLKKAEDAMEKSMPSTLTMLPELALKESDREILSRKMNEAKQPLIVVGSLPAGQSHGPLIEWLDQGQCPLFLDVTSGLKYRYPVGERALPGFDHPEVVKLIENNSIDLIIHLGGPVVSKHYYQFLTAHPEIFVVHVHDSFLMNDPSFSVDLRIFADPLVIAKSLPAMKGGMSAELKKGSAQLIADKSQIIDKSPLSNPYISKNFIDHIENNELIVISNSMAIRSFDSYGSLTTKKDLTIVTNRGASGIEGILSTAIGASSALQQKAHVIIGDVAMIHDLNAFSQLKTAAFPIRIIIINNQGGGIFRLLPIAQDERTLKAIETRHDYNFAPIAQMFGLHYQVIANTEQFDQLMKQELQQHEIIEIQIPHENNDEIYRKLKTIRIG